MRPDPYNLLRDNGMAPKNELVLGCQRWISGSGVVAGFDIRDYVVMYHMPNTAIVCAGGTGSNHGGVAGKRVGPGERVGTPVGCGGVAGRRIEQGGACRLCESGSK